jgi:hypothetical protein
MAAADNYEQVLAKISAADTSEEAFRSAAGKENLARLVDEVAQLEARAVGEMELGLMAMHG